MNTVLITGANSGLGFETARRLAAAGRPVILACRNHDRAEAALEKILDESPNAQVTTLALDTSSLKSVRAAVDSLSGVKLAGLINNAGISPLHDGKTPDGFELVFATNYLGHFLLTLLLLPQLTPTARIVNVTSDMHNPPGGITWPGIEHLAHPSKVDRRKYSYSKLANLYFTYALARRLKAQGSKITVNAFNPGMMQTNFAPATRTKEEVDEIKRRMPDRIGDLDTSADTLAEMMTKPSLSKRSGAYVDRDRGVARSSELSYDERNQEELWEASLRFTGMETLDE